MYPIYGNMNNAGMMPGMPTPQPVMPNMQGGMAMQDAIHMQSGVPMQNANYGTNYGPADSNSSLTVQVNNLEKRVARLEGMMSSNNSTPSYSESNFYVV